jgi:GTP cyclohydrolase II
LPLTNVKRVTEPTERPGARELEPRMVILTASGLAAAQPDSENPKESEMHVPVKEIRPQLEVLAKAPLPTRHGTFEMQVFRYRAEEASSSLSDEHVALVMGPLTGRSHVPIRIHSECLTSEVFGSLKCDCKDQLEAAQAEIARRGFGAVLYLRQEGRGIGLANKVRAYALQAHGADTVDANRLLGLPDDARRYDAAAAMLHNLGVRSVELLTNNPAKEEALRALGVDVSRRIPVLVATNPFSASYLETKRSRMRHAIPIPVSTANHTDTATCGGLALAMNLRK